VRRAGVRQFLHVYHRLKDIEQDDLLWGEELEYGIFKVRTEMVNSFVLLVSSNAFVVEMVGVVDWVWQMADRSSIQLS
jgi:hypothetical protein